MRRCELWQKDWNGISLVDIAEAKGLNPSRLAAEDFYGFFYENLKMNGYKFSEDFLHDKAFAREFINGAIEEYIEDTGIGNPKILSLGCGTGIIEEELLSKYDIELQECQESSFDYLHKKGKSASREWVTVDLSEIPENTYDIVYAFSIMYSFEDEDYKNFVKNASKLLSANGRLIIVDVSETYNNVIKTSMKLLVKRLLKQFVPSINEFAYGIKWGYIRAKREHERLLKEGNVIVYRRDFLYSMQEKQTSVHCGGADWFPAKIENDLPMRYIVMYCSKNIGRIGC